MLRVRIVLICLIGLVSETAFAHSPIQGIGSFYNGLLHPILVPAHLLLLAATGLFLGQQGLKKIGLILAIYAAATLFGLILAWFSIVRESEIFVLTLSAFIGLLVVIKPQERLLWSVAIALLTGLFLGIDSAQEALSGTEKLQSLFGSGIAIYFLIIYPMILADKFNQKPWQKIGIRILGSWIAASSLLVLAFSFATKIK